MSKINITIKGLDLTASHSLAKKILHVVAHKKSNNLPVSEIIKHNFSEESTEININV